MRGNSAGQTPGRWPWPGTNSRAGAAGTDGLRRGLGMGTVNGGSAGLGSGSGGERAEAAPRRELAEAGARGRDGELPMFTDPAPGHFR